MPWLVLIYLTVKASVYNFLITAFEIREIFGVNSSVVFFTPLVASYNNSRRKYWDTKQVIPFPHLEGRKRVFFSLLAEKKRKTATFSNIGEVDMWSSLSVLTNFVLDCRL